MFAPSVLCIVVGGILALLALLPDAHAFTDSMNKKDWTYTLISITSNTTDAERVEWDLVVDRVGRSQYTISGTLKTNCVMDDEYFIEVKLYRSASGGNQYKLEPFSIPRQTIGNFLANTYKKMVANSLVDCSDLPQADGDNPPQLEVKTYTLEKCIVSTEMFPSHMEPSYYKVLVLGSGPVEYAVEIFVEVDRKL